MGPGSKAKLIASRSAPWRNRLPVGASRETTWAHDQQKSIVANKSAPWRSRLQAGVSRETTWAHDQKHTSSRPSRHLGNIESKPARPERQHGSAMKITSSQAGRLHGYVDCRPAGERQHGHAINNLKIISNKPAPWRSRL